VFICTILSSSSKDKNRVVGASNYPNWITFSKSPNSNNDYFQIISYINVRFLYMFFSDDHQSALMYLKNTKVNICNVLIMIDNFNIRNLQYNSQPYIEINDF